MSYFSTSILRVEDGPNGSLLPERAFYKANFPGRLHFVADGDKPVPYFSRNRPNSERVHYPLPGLALLDFMGPRGLGLELLEWNRRQPFLSQLPAGIPGSSKQALGIKHANHSVTNPYLTKAGAFGSLVNMVRRLHADWFALIERPGGYVVASAGPAF